MSSTIKLEDVSPLLRLTPPSASSPTPAPSTPSSCSRSSTAKPSKKRKSWGQILPEPKTNLPPRKRAKTDDEKEQRRIERVKRNRHAAHLSREKKRQEFEEVLFDRDALAARVQELEAQLEHYQKLVSEASFGTPCTDMNMIQSFKFNDIPTPPPSITMNSQVTCPSPPLTEAAEHSLDTLDSLDSLDSLPPLDFSSQASPPAEEPTVPIQTQHSAAMLWDLQCRIGTSGPLTTTPFQRQRYFQAMIHYLISMNLQIFLTSLSLIRSWTLTTLAQRVLVSAATSNNNLFTLMSSPVQQTLSGRSAMAQQLATSLALLCRSSIGGSVDSDKRTRVEGSEILLGSQWLSATGEVEPTIIRALTSTMARRHGVKEVSRGLPKRKLFPWR